MNVNITLLFIVANKAGFYGLVSKTGIQKGQRKEREERKETEKAKAKERDGTTDKPTFQAGKKPLMPTYWLMTGREVLLQIMPMLLGNMQLPQLPLPLICPYHRNNQQRLQVCHPEPHHHQCQHLLLHLLQIHNHHHLLKNPNCDRA